MHTSKRQKRSWECRMLDWHASGLEFHHSTREQKKVKNLECYHQKEMKKAGEDTYIQYNLNIIQCIHWNPMYPCIRTSEHTSISQLSFCYDKLLDTHKLKKELFLAHSFRWFSLRSVGSKAETTWQKGSWSKTARFMAIRKQSTEEPKQETHLPMVPSVTHLQQATTPKGNIQEHQ